MDLDGPAAVYRWRGGASCPGDEDSVVFEERIEKVLDVPHGTGEDHAEGMTFCRLAVERRSLLVVYDSPSPAGLGGGASFLADTFDL